MPGKYLDFPFDDELFLMRWQAAQDPTLTAMITSGAVQQNSEIANMISNGSNLYTIPFYNVLGGDDDNYDGNANITLTATSGGYQSGVVYGRAHAWKAQDFVYDFNSGADPMQNIVSQVDKYWQKKRQARMLGILKGIFSITDDNTDNWDQWQLHTTNIAVQKASTPATEANCVGATTVGDAMQKAVGDNSGIFAMAWMHSKVATNLAGLQLLNFRKYTDAQGIERQLAIADLNGQTVIVDDGCPVSTNPTSGLTEYTTYLMGTGALQMAKAPVKNAVEHGRERLTNGGYDYIVTRLRETIHPNGFTYTLPTSSGTAVISPTDTQLGTAAQWSLCGVDARTIPMARIISNG